MRGKNMNLRAAIILSCLACLLPLPAACSKPVEMTGKRSLSGELIETISDRQRITMERMRTLGEAVFQYVMDNPAWGPPRVGGISGLVDALTRYGLKESKINIYDGWGNVLIYEYGRSANGWSFSISSYGSDSLRGPVAMITDGKYIVIHSDEDIVYSNGSFVQYPLEER